MNSLPLMPALFALTAFVSTMLGGLFALKNKNRLHHILGFTAGILLGVVAFDLLPEIFNLLNETKLDPTIPMITLVIGFLGFHIVEKLTAIHTAHEGEYQQDHKHPRLGQISALALIGHSFFDGVGIGLAFQVNTTVGIAVAMAVIAHDFADGLNTVSLMLSHHNASRSSLGFLILDALAPVLGALSTLLFVLNSTQLVMYLGFFVGFLLYIGSSDILPEAHAKHSSRLTILLTVTGTVLMYLVTRVSLG